MNGPRRSTASLAAELSQLRERLETAHRRLEILHERLRTSGSESQPRVVELHREQAGRRRHGRPEPLPARAAESVWPIMRLDPPPLQPTPGSANLTLTGLGVPAVGFSVCGFGRAELERLVTLVARKQTVDRNFVPVFLTDVMAAEVFRRHRYVFEYFPAAGAARDLAGTESWQDYARRRLALIKRKYALTQIVIFGKQPFCAD